MLRDPDSAHIYSTSALCRPWSEPHAAGRSPKWCDLHSVVCLILGEQSFWVFLRSACCCRVHVCFLKSTQARDETLFMYAYTACMSLITMHAHVGLPSCGIRIYMVAGLTNTAQCTSLVATHQAQAETTYSQA